MPATKRPNTSLPDADRAAIRDLRRIPGIGPSLAQDLMALGYRRVDDLQGQDPEAMYRRLETLTGHHQDRCVLYVFRCAVHFAQTPNPHPDDTKWWNWKDGGKASGGQRG